MQRQLWDAIPTELQMIIAKLLDDKSVVKLAMSSQDQNLMRIVALQLTLNEAATQNILVDDGLKNKIKINFNANHRHVTPIDETPTPGEQSGHYKDFSISLNENGKLVIRAADQIITFLNPSNIQYIIQAKHPFFIDADGSLWTLGTIDGDNIKLANTNEIIELSLVKFNDINNIESFLVYKDCLFIIQKNGQAWMQGNVTYVHGKYATAELPQKVKCLPVKDIFSTPLHTIFIHRSGQVSICGHSGFYENSNPIPLQIIDNLSNIEKVFANRNHIFFVNNEGKAKACGLNNFRSLGIGDLVDSVRLIKPREIKSPEPITHISTFNKISYFFHHSGRTYISNNEHPTPTLETQALKRLAEKQEARMHSFKFKLNDLLSLSMFKAKEHEIFYQAALNLLLSQGGRAHPSFFALDKSPHKTPESLELASSLALPDRNNAKKMV